MLIVIFNWTYQGRFKFANKEGDGWSFSITQHDQSLPAEFLIAMDRNRSKPIWEKEHSTRINFINNTLKNNKIVHWSWVNTIHLKDKHMTITHETNGRINDMHYGEEGHKELYGIISNGIKTNRVFQHNILNS